MIRNIYTLIKIFKLFFYKDTLIETIIKNNFKYFINNNKNYKKEFLIDYFESVESEVPRLYFINQISSKYSCKISTFSLKKNILFNNQWRRFYKSGNINNFNYIFFSFFYLRYFFKFKKKKKLKKLFNSLKNKDQILKIKYKDLDIGRDIYDEYLYRYKKPTVDLQDKNLEKIIFETYFFIDYWIDYFKKNDVIGISLSHPNVRLQGVIGKVANYYFEIPVYSITKNYFKKRCNLFDHNSFIRNNLLSIPKKFSKLNQDKKNEAIEWSKNRLDTRLSGKVGVDMNYSNESAFGDKEYDRVLNKNNKIKILICTHEFHDNPHSTGGLLFPDFYEWLLFLGEKSKNSSHEWYIKNHPDCDNWTKNIVEDFVKKFPKINLVDQKISFLQLKKEGLNFVFTCHGTVGHEMPLLDIQVINADTNHPHIGYDFNWSPKSINEYIQMIDDLPNLKKVVDKNEIYEFYFIYHTSNKQYSLFDSDLTIKQTKNNKIIDLFTSQLTKKRHEEIIKNINQII